MLTALSRARPVLLVILGLGTLGVVVSLARDQVGFLAAAAAAHLALYLFVITEAFGPTAKLRSRAARTFAKVVLVPYTLLIVVILAQIIAAPASLMSAPWK